MSKTKANLVFNKEQNLYVCEGDWSILTIDSLFRKFKQQVTPRNTNIIIDGKGLTSFDSSGALTLIQCVDWLKANNNQVDLKNLTSQQHDLLTLLEKKQEILTYSPPLPKRESLVYMVGEESVNKMNQMKGLVILIGDLTEKLIIAFYDWRRFQFPSIVSNIFSTGVTALPIIGLLSFLIGVVLAYQMGLQLETYGANIFIAYLSGMAIFREFAPLITAIIVAGRTSSAFTAQIGSMKINEEIDALYTMGLSPTELLVVPKVLGLLLFFPLLIFWADFFSTIGAMIMSKAMLHVGYRDFLTRLHETVGFKQMLLGLYKAPTFALLIALVGCFQGFRVESNSDSLGAQTTKSVVQALFLIIVADAIYSVIYSWLNL